MHKNDIIEALSLGEDDDWEFKDCRVSIGKSVWETVSAFANTSGGVIVFGVESSKKDDEHKPVGVAKPKQYQDELWSLLHNKKTTISYCPCGKGDIWSAQVAGADLVCMRVPSVDRKHRPVYVGENPLTGTFKRRRSGDYRCDADEVRQMLRDQSSTPQDAIVFHGTKAKDVDAPTLRAYRNVFASKRSSHPHLKLSDSDLLKKIGALRDRDQDKGLTLAGILMFGTADVIRDAFPNVFFDYYQSTSRDPATRYDDRITSSDGDWEPNLFNFYYKAYPKLVEGLKIAFGLDEQAMRDGTSPFHDALREALVNALVHADYMSRGSVLIGRCSDAYVFQNPGRSLTPVHRIVEARHAGEKLSDIRNPNLVDMFFLPGLAERHGTGYPTIFSAWDGAHRHSPRIEEDLERNTVTVTLPLLSQIAPEVEKELSRIVGPQYAFLQPLDRDILVQAYQFGEVTNTALQFSRAEHPRDIGARLKFLSDKGWLRREGAAGRGRTYKFAAPDLLPSRGSDPPRLDPTVKAFLNEVLQHPNPSRELVQALILDLCKDEFRTTTELAELMKRSKVKLQRLYLRPMVTDGRLALRYARNHPNQAYKAASPARRRSS